MAKRIQLPITITLPPDFIARISQQKLRESRSTSEIIRDALRVYYGIGADTRQTSLA
jgi:Ribbon-helix-helix protein, copG family